MVFFSRVAGLADSGGAVDLDIYYICGIIIALSSHNYGRKTWTGLNYGVQGLDAHTLWTRGCTVAGLVACVKTRWL